MSEPLVFVLLNGREIIATVKEETETHYIVENAMAFHIAEAPRTKANEEGLAVMQQPISFFSDHDEQGINLSINRAALAFEPMETNAKMRDFYTQQKSPIQLIQQPTGFVRG